MSSESRPISISSDLTAERYCVWDAGFDDEFKLRCLWSFYFLDSMSFLNQETILTPFCAIRPIMLKYIILSIGFKLVTPKMRQICFNCLNLSKASDCENDEVNHSFSVITMRYSILQCNES